MSQMSIFDSKKQIEQELADINIKNSATSDNVKQKIIKLLASEEYQEISELILYDNCSRYKELREFTSSLLPDGYYFKLIIFSPATKETCIKKYKYDIGQKVTCRKFDAGDVEIISRGPWSRYQVKGGKMGEFDCEEYELSDESNKWIET